jgi:hypothetical protein
VDKALHKLGVPTASDIDALVERIDELNRTVSSLSAKLAARQPTGRQPAGRAAKPAAKRAAARKTST